MKETWNSEQQWIVAIMPQTRTLPGAADVHPAIVDDYVAGLDMMPQIVHAGMMGRNAGVKPGELIRDMLRTMHREDTVDPAFLFAMDKTMWTPR